MKTVKRFAPAKVNLFLEVTGKRADGYHELATLFAKIDLGDWVTVRAKLAAKTDITLNMSGPLGASLKADETNLAWRAAQLFFNHFHISAHCELEVEKHTPMGAGLGGGSSDAGAVLCALCEIFDKNRFELIPDAAKLGADIPLFLYEETFLKGLGIGDQLIPLAIPGPFPWLVLVYPNVAVPTKDVFAKLTLPDPQLVLTKCSNLDKLILYLKEGRPLPAWRDLLFNRLEEGVYSFIEPVRNVKNDFNVAGAEAVLMSGSGSTVFALMQDGQQAKKLASNVDKQGRKVFLTTFRRSYEDNGNKNTPNGGRSLKGLC